MICSCAPVFNFLYTPPDGAGIEYQISHREFSDFMHTYYCDFLNNVYSYGSVFSCDDGQCDAHPAGIAVLLFLVIYLFLFIYFLKSFQLSKFNPFFGISVLLNHSIF